MKALAERDPFRIGLAAIAAAGVAGLLILGYTFLPIGKSTYIAYLEQTAGLRVGEDVEIYGVPVGQITGIALDGDRVEVRFTVDNDIELGEETRADVRVATLLGTHYLAVSPAGSGDLSAIPLSRTTVPFNLQDVLEKGTGAVEDLDPVLLAKALTETSKTLSATSENLGPALEGVARLSEAVQKRSGQTTALLAAAEKVTTQLSDSSEDIVVLMRQANLVLGEVRARREAIHTLLTETRELGASLAGIIRGTDDDLAPAFRKLNRVLTTLREQDKVLKGILDDTAPTMRYIANATGNGPWGDLWLKPPALPPDDLRCKLGGNC